MTKDILNAKGARYLVAILILASVPLWLGGSPYAMSVVIGIVMFSIPALGAWLLLNAGLWSFGQGVFASLGAYTAALLMLREGVNFWPALLAGGALAGAFAALVVFPFLRTSGVAFSILTLVALSAFDELVLLVPSLSGGGGGLIAVPGLPSTRILGLQLSSTDGQYAVIAAIAILALIAVYRLEVGGYLRVLKAVAKNGALAESVGVNTKALRASCFIFAAVITGLAGAFSAAELQTAQQNVWDLFPSIYIVAYGIVGGTRSAFGPLVGTAAVMALSSELAASGAVSSNSIDPIVVGVGLIVVVLALPGGLVQLGVRAIRPVTRRLANVGSLTDEGRCEGPDAASFDASLAEDRARSRPSIAPKLTSLQTVVDWEQGEA